MYYSIIILFPYSLFLCISLYLSGSIKPQENLASRKWAVLLILLPRTAAENSGKSSPGFFVGFALSSRRIGFLQWNSLQVVRIQRSTSLSNRSREQNRKKRRALNKKARMQLCVLNGIITLQQQEACVPKALLVLVTCALHGMDTGEGRLSGKMYNSSA